MTVRPLLGVPSAGLSDQDEGALRIAPNRPHCVRSLRLRQYLKAAASYRAYKYILLANGTILIIEPASLKIVYVIAA